VHERKNNKRCVSCVWSAMTEGKVAGKGRQMERKGGEVSKEKNVTQSKN